MRKLLSGKIDQSLIDSLFSSDRVLQIEANAELDFLSNYFNAKYTPITVKYFSVVRNEANPDVDLYAVQEENGIAQSGYEIARNLYVGIQIRDVDRKYIRKQFQLLDLATDEGKNELKPQTQQAVYFEPGAAYTLNFPWYPTFSVMVANLGFHNGNWKDLSEPVDVQYAASLAPPVPWGALRIEVDYRRMNYEEKSFEEGLRAGAIYRLGAMYLAGGLDYNGISGGLYFTLQQLSAGILYSTTKVPWLSDDYYAQTVYVQAGWKL